MGGGTDMQRTLFKKIISLSAGTVRERESGEKMQRARTPAGEGCLSPSIFNEMLFMLPSPKQLGPMI